MKLFYQIEIKLLSVKSFTTLCERHKLLDLLNIINTMTTLIIKCTNVNEECVL